MVPDIARHDAEALWLEQARHDRAAAAQLDSADRSPTWDVLAKLAAKAADTPQPGQPRHGGQHRGHVDRPPGGHARPHRRYPGSNTARPPLPGAPAAASRKQATANAEAVNPQCKDGLPSGDGILLALR